MSMLVSHSSLGFPPPDGSGYVFVSADPERLGKALQRYNAMARVAGFLGDPTDEAVLGKARTMGQEMFRVENVELVEVADS